MEYFNFATSNNISDIIYHSDISDIKNSDIFMASFFPCSLIFAETVYYLHLFLSRGLSDSICPMAHEMIQSNLEALKLA